MWTDPNKRKQHAPSSAVTGRVSNGHFFTGRVITPDEARRNPIFSPPPTMLNMRRALNVMPTLARGMSTEARPMTRCAPRDPPARSPTPALPLPNCFASGASQLSAHSCMRQVCAVPL